MADIRKLRQAFKIVKKDDTLLSISTAIQHTNKNNGDSLNKRYFYKLFANFIGFVIGLVTAGIVPRGLGPKAYGNFEFLTNFFSQIAGFLDMGTSTAFYTKLSQRQKEFGLVSFYLCFMGIVSLFIVGFVGIVHLTSAHKQIWPGQTMFFVYLAAGWGFLTWAIQVFNKMTDAYGLTVPAEKARILQRILGIILIIILYIFHQLNLANLFYYHYVVLFFLGGIFIWIMERRGYSIRHSWMLSWPKIKGYLQEFYHYSHPLFTYSLIGLIVAILDRWLLQIFAGSIQQGFYGLSYRIGGLCFLFTSAMTPLLLREFSIAFGNKDLPQMAILFRRYIPLLYSIAAYFACFIAIQADKVVYILGGKSYGAAVVAVTIMAFYPLHQTYGQLSGSVFYATGQTKLYRNIGVIFMLIGLPVTYFLIAPTEKMGLNAGATGLAIKMVALQFIWVNTQLYFNARLLNLSFKRYLGHQIFSVGCLLTIAYIATFSIDQIIGLNQNIIFGFILAGIVYTLLVAGIVYYLPVVFGLKRQDIQSVVRLIKGRN